MGKYYGLIILTIFFPVARVVVTVSPVDCARVYFRRSGSCLRSEGGEFFLCRTFVYFSRSFWFLLEQVEGDEVQAAVVPPAPGLMRVVMGSVNILMGFSWRYPAGRFPYAFALFSSPSLCLRCTVRRPPPHETLGLRRCWYLTIWG